MLQKHKDSGADITISCVPMDERYTLLFFMIQKFVNLYCIAKHLFKCWALEVLKFQDGITLLLAL